MESGIGGADAESGVDDPWEGKVNGDGAEFDKVAMDSGCGSVTSPSVDISVMSGKAVDVELARVVTGELTKGGVRSALDKHGECWHESIGGTDSGPELVFEMTSSVEDTV